MRVHHVVVAMLAVTVAALLAAAAFAHSVAPGFNDPVKITNTSCHLNHTSTSSGATTIVFGITNSGTVAHGFDISTKYKSGLIKPGQEKTLTTHLSPGSYRYACVAAHSTVKKGVFTTH
jgi:Cupredoxin-like domain